MNRLHGKNLLSFVCSACLAASLVAVPASALEYTFESDIPGGTFYQSTSTDSNYIANNSQIVVGADGTVSGNTTGNVSSSPLSVLDLPVGEYPDAWGTATDIAIAQNSVFVNELGPTAQNSAYYQPIYLPGSVMSGAIPTGYQYGPSAIIPSSVLAPGAYGMGVNGAYSIYNPTGAAVSGNGAYFGLGTSTVAMPTITSGGAIGRLSIPSVGINKYVYEGTSQTSMKKGLAHFDCTSGWQGNIALAGHNRGNTAHFAKLKDVKLGDTVQYTTAYGTATYVVSNITTVATSDTSGLVQDGTNKITMYTCKMNQPEVKLCVVATMVGTNL